MSVFLRPHLAQQMANQLLCPSVLDEAFRSGLFISGLRRTGKTTFLHHDLIPALEASGAIVIYVDLWSDTQANPAKLLHVTVRNALTDIQKPQSRFLQQLAKLRSLDVGIMGLKFGFKIETLGDANGPTLAQAFQEVVDQVKTNIVLIVDEVQHAMTTEEGNQMLFALKSARDTINQRPNTPGYFIFVGTGSHRAMVQELSTRRTQAFAGAVQIPYPLLDEHYVKHVFARMVQESTPTLPKPETANEAFKTLGNRPEEFLLALRRQIIHCQATGDDPDTTLRIVASTIRAMAAEQELNRVEEMGGLSKAIFEKIAATDGNAKGIFSTAAAVDYTATLGREIKVEEIQPAANELLAANLIIRRGHGIYTVSDPFVQQVWRERQTLLDGRPNPFWGTQMEG